MAFKGYKQTEEHKLKKATAKRRGRFFNCLVCLKEFWRMPSEIKNGECKFCSKKCYQVWIKGKPRNPKSIQKQSENNLKKARFLTKRRLRIFLQGTTKYKNWRLEVFKRDFFICQKCGAGRVYLEAHHIKPFATYPELRFEVSNGVSLCKPCHTQEPKGKEVYAIKN